MLKLDSIITNGYVDISTIDYYLEKGWKFVCTVPAFPTHPHALGTDKLTIFSKYTDPEFEEGETCKPNKE